MTFAPLTARSPFAGCVTMTYVSASLSLSVAVSAMLVGVSSRVVAERAEAVGASLIGRTVIATVTMFESRGLSFALKVKLSPP